MGVKNQLLSYFYFRTQLRAKSIKTHTMLARMKRAKAKGYRFMLDSGAFTYKTNKAPELLPPPLAYFNEYFDFVSEYHELFDVIVEFDVDGWAIDPATKEPVTTEQVDSWTDRFLAIPAIAPKIMPVYDGGRGDRWLTSWLLDVRSPYIGISSSTLAGIGKLIAKAHRFGKFAHGFAQTRIKTDLKFTPFDSIDSTTWLRADRYGGTCIFRNDKFIVLDHLHKADRRIYKNYFEQWGLDWNLIAKDDLHEMRKATITAWRELSNSFEAKWLFKTGGKLPYLAELHKQGRVPSEHPLLTRKRAERDAGK